MHIFVYKQLLKNVKCLRYIFKIINILFSCQRRFDFLMSVFFSFLKIPYMRPYFLRLKPHSTIFTAVHTVLCLLFANNYITVIYRPTVNPKHYSIYTIRWSAAGAAWMSVSISTVMASHRCDHPVALLACAEVERKETVGGSPESLSLCAISADVGAWVCVCVCRFGPTPPRILVLEINAHTHWLRRARRYTRDGINRIDIGGSN